jgi:hypothetical protein
MFFSLPSWAVALIVFAVIGAATAAGYATGHYLREHQATLREPFGVLQAALLVGVVGLILAFGLSLAVGRYEARRAALVTEANAIGTTYLRGQLLAEPVAQQVARAAPPLHRPRAAGLQGGAGQRRHATHDSGRRTSSNDAFGASPGRPRMPHRSTLRRGSTSRPSTRRSTPRRHASRRSTTVFRRSARARGIRRLPRRVGLLALHISILGPRPGRDMLAARRS